MAPKIHERLFDPVTVTTGLESFFINPHTSLTRDSKKKNDSLTDTALKHIYLSIIHRYSMGWIYGRGGCRNWRYFHIQFPNERNLSHPIPQGNGSSEKILKNLSIKYHIIFGKDKLI